MNIRIGLLAFALTSTAFGGELEEGFRNPPVEAEPGVSAEAAGDLAALKAQSDADCLKGVSSVVCNRSWPFANELVRYVARCRFLLKAGEPAAKDCLAVSGASADVPYVCRSYKDGTVGCFLAYPLDAKRASVRLSLAIDDKYPELWDPMTGRIVQPDRREVRAGRCLVTWRADPGASLFVMMRPKKSKAKKVAKVVDSRIQAIDVKGTWTPALAPGRADAGVAYRLADALVSLDDYPSAVWLDLGEARGVVEVKANGKALPPLWAPPYRVDLVDVLKFAEDRHTVEPGAVVGQQASLELELKVTGALGTVKWETAFN